MTFDRDTAAQDLVAIIRAWLDRTLDAHEEAVAQELFNELPASLAKAFASDPSEITARQFVRFGLPSDARAVGRTHARRHRA